MFEKFIDKNIILASQSPRRQQLLKELGLTFEIKVIDNIEEKYPENLNPEEITMFLAEHKANHYKNIIKENDILITADTIVCLENEILGKPENRSEAVKILRKLSGKSHFVITGMCLMTQNQKKTFYSKTEVFFKKLTEEEIFYYIDNFQPYDKAGAYGIQEWIGLIGIERVNGSYFNVVGLPVQKLFAELKNFI